MQFLANKIQHTHTQTYMVTLYIQTATQASCYYMCLHPINGHGTVAIENAFLRQQHTNDPLECWTTTYSFNTFQKNLLQLQRCIQQVHWQYCDVYSSLTATAAMSPSLVLPATPAVTSPGPVLPKIALWRYQVQSCRRSRLWRHQVQSCRRWPQLFCSRAT